MGNAGKSANGMTPLRVAAVLLAMALAAPALGLAQAAPSPAAQTTEPQKPAAGGGSNPFPEDTGNVPVLPNTSEKLAASAEGNEVPPVTADLPASDADPVRSPDDGAPTEDAGSASGFSSSRTGLDSILPDPNAPDPKDKSHKHSRPEAPPHVETAREDVQVGKYYLDNRNWRAALSRYQSAMVLSPDDPEVYWGMAESQRHLGDMAGAQANYQKVVDYDPDSRHGKDAAKLLRSHELDTPKPTQASK